MGQGQDRFNKIFLIVIAVGIAYTVLHVTILEAFLIIYIATAVLFDWNGSVPLLGGIVLYAFTRILVKSRPDFNAGQLELYSWYLIGTGLLLMVWKRVLNTRERIFFWLKSVVPKLKSVVQIRPQIHMPRIVVPIPRLRWHDFFSSFRLARLWLTQFVASTMPYLRNVFKQGVVFTGRVLVMGSRYCVLEFINLFKVTCQYGRRVYHIVFGHFSRRMKGNIISMVAALFILFFFTKFNAGSVLLLLFALAIFLFNLDRRLPLAASIGFFLATAGALIAGVKETIIETLVLYAYYCMLIGVLGALYTGRKKIIHDSVY